MDVIGAAAAGLCGRNSAIGLKGGWGNFFFGNWDTPNKLMVSPIRGWFGLNNAYAGDGRMLWSAPASATGNTGASFHRRQKNGINYHSPNWGGFAFRAMYSAQNEATSLAASTLPGKPRMWAADVTYTAGPLYLGAGYERHKNFNPGGTTVGALASQYAGGDDYNWTLGVSYTFGGFLRLGAIWTRSNYEVTNVSELRKDGWWLIGDWTISGPHSLKAKWSKTGDTKGSGAVGSVAAGAHRPGVAGTGGTVWGVNYAYEFSKRTTGYIGYNRVSNDASSSYSLGIAASSTGGTQSVYGIGWRHRF
jgi:predicted porin